MVQPKSHARHMVRFATAFFEDELASPSAVAFLRDNFRAMVAREPGCRVATTLPTGCGMHAQMLVQRILHVFMRQIWERMPTSNTCLSLPPSTHPPTTQASPHLPPSGANMWNTLTARWSQFCRTRRMNMCSNICLGKKSAATRNDSPMASTREC